MKIEKTIVKQIIKEEFEKIKKILVLENEKKALLNQLNEYSKINICEEYIDKTQEHPAQSALEMNAKKAVDMAIKAVIQQGYLEKLIDTNALLSEEVFTNPMAISDDKKRAITSDALKSAGIENIEDLKDKNKLNNLISKILLSIGVAGAVSSILTVAIKWFLMVDLAIISKHPNEMFVVLLTGLIFGIITDFGNKLSTKVKIKKQRDDMFIEIQKLINLIKTKQMAVQQSGISDKLAKFKEYDASIDNKVLKYNTLVNQYQSAIINK